MADNHASSPPRILIFLLCPFLTHRYRQLKENKGMTGIQYGTDEKGRKAAVQIDRRKCGAVLEDVWDGLISESRRHKKEIPLAWVKVDLVKLGRLRE
jgi:hypothetical protein